MTRAAVAEALRGLAFGCVAAALLVVVQAAGGRFLPVDQLGVLLPFLAVAAGAAVLPALLPHLDRLVARVAPQRRVTPYSALADAARRVQAGSLDETLPGLAAVVADGTGARQASVWLAVEGRLVEAARRPAGPVAAAEEPVPNLAVLIARPDTDHVVPVLEGTALRAALAISKPAALSVADRRLMRDVANGAGLLLRVVALHAELTERVTRAADLAAELQASQRRLASARDAERRRLLAELSHATSDRLAALHAGVAAAREDLAATEPDADGARAALAGARSELDDLLERFRAVARGVYPAVLRDQGPAAALDEVIADLPRAVRLLDDTDRRLGWEIESGVYYLAASAVRELAGRPADTTLLVRLAPAEGRITVHIEDGSPPVPAERLVAVLADDAERLAALGGDMEISSGDDGGAADDAVAAGADTGPRPFVLRAWLPDRLEPVVETGSRAEPAVG